MSAIDYLNGEEGSVTSGFLGFKAGYIFKVYFFIVF
jgi:hypothetical protein